MKPKVSVFVATSLDGFIARKDGSLDWLDKANEKMPAGEDCGYQPFIDSVDVLVMGRNTFEKVLSFNEWPHGDKRVIVLSSTMAHLPSLTEGKVELANEKPRDLIERLEREGVRSIYVDGGVTIQKFIREGLVDEITITTIPVLLGEGIPLFGSIEGDVWMRHKSTKSFPFGFVQTKYYARGSQD